MSGTVYLIKPREESGITAKPRLVRAERRSSVEAYALQSFSIEKATIDDAIALGAEGVVIEDAQG